MVLGSAVTPDSRLVNSARLIGLIAVSVVLLLLLRFVSALMQDTQEKYLAELQESRAALERRALYDELTEVAESAPARRAGSAQVLAIAERENQVVALFYIDLDGFKAVNDLFGHGIGDLLLKQVAQRMLSRVRKSDTLARMGGDEFTWLVAHLSENDQAARLATEMLETLSTPYAIEGRTIEITASVGITLFPEEDSTDHCRPDTTSRQCHVRGETRRQEWSALLRDGAGERVSPASVKDIRCELESASGRGSRAPMARLRTPAQPLLAQLGEVDFEAGLGQQGCEGEDSIAVAGGFGAAEDVGFGLHDFAATAKRVDELLGLVDVGS